MKEILDKEIELPKGKIYSEIGIRIGTFLGGPMVAGYLIAENYKSLGEQEKVSTTWIYTVIATFLIYMIIFLIPEDLPVPNIIYPIIYIAIASYLVQKHQGTKINDFLSSGGAEYSRWKAAGIGLIGMVGTLLIMLVIAFLTDPTIFDF